MTVTVPQVEKLLTSKDSFTQLGFSMLVNKLRIQYKTNSTPNMVAQAVMELNAFLKKHHSVMVKADFAALQRMYS